MGSVARIIKKTKKAVTKPLSKAFKGIAKGIKKVGKATMRGRVHKTPKSILLVVKTKSGLAQAARNLPGVDVVAAKDLNAEDLAPGGDIGRLTVFTKSALEALN